MNRAILVTVSRQFGSGGAYVGRMVARRLGYEYIDRKILKEAASRLGEDEAGLLDREERLSSFWENLFRVFMVGAPEAAYIPPPLKPIYDKDLFDAEAAIINEVADRYNAVIVGRGGFHVLKGRAGLVNVFIHAPITFRVRRIMELYNIQKEKDAHELVEDMDRKRGEFIRTMTGAVWSDARNYHLSIDTGRADFKTAEEMVVRLVESVKSKLGL